MDSSRFDELTKALATATSRRQALKTIVATTLGGILGLGRLGTALAGRGPKCHRNGLGCDTNSQCCSGYCKNGEKCACAPNGATCTDGSNCCSGTCCQGTCCGSGQVCLSNGTCATPCGAAGCDSSPCACNACNCDRDLCGAMLIFTGCSNDNGCPTGQFCAAGYCVTAC
jgi:hypothetical protein